MRINKILCVSQATLTQSAYFCSYVQVFYQSGLPEWVASLVPIKNKCEMFFASTQLWMISLEIELQAFDH